MRLGGFLTGLLILAGLEVVTSSPGAASRTAAIPTFLAAAVERVISPDLGLIPNFADHTAPLAHGNAIAAVKATANRAGGTIRTHAGDRVRGQPPNATL